MEKIEVKEQFIAVECGTGAKIDVLVGTVLEENGDDWNATYNGITLKLEADDVDTYLVGMSLISEKRILKSFCCGKTRFDVEKEVNLMNIDIVAITGDTPVYTVFYYDK